MSSVRVTITVCTISTLCITLRRGRRAGNEIKVVGEELRLAKRRRVIVPRIVILELREGEGILFSDPVVNTRVS